MNDTYRSAHLRRQAEWAIDGPRLTKRDEAKRLARESLVAEVERIAREKREAAQPASAAQWIAGEAPTDPTATYSTPDKDALLERARSLGLKVDARFSPQRLMAMIMSKGGE
jgi:hypothetical protein